MARAGAEVAEMQKTLLEDSVFGGSGGSLRESGGWGGGSVGIEAREAESEERVPAGRRVLMDPRRK